MSDGLWVLAGNCLDVYGLQSNSEMPVEIASIGMERDEKPTFSVHRHWPVCKFGAHGPGANDSDSDGMPDGWELAYGLDPPLTGMHFSMEMSMDSVEWRR